VRQSVRQTDSRKFYRDVLSVPKNLVKVEEKIAHTRTRSRSMARPPSFPRWWPFCRGGCSIEVEERRRYAVRSGGFRRSWSRGARRNSSLQEFFSRQGHAAGTGWPCRHGNVCVGAAGPPSHAWMLGTLVGAAFTDARRPAGGPGAGLSHTGWRTLPPVSTRARMGASQLRCCRHKSSRYEQCRRPPGVELHAGTI